jgi:hypothetical protein
MLSLLNMRLRLARDRRIHVIDVGDLQAAWLLFQTSEANPVTYSQRTRNELDVTQSYVFCLVQQSGPSPALILTASGPRRRQTTSSETLVFSGTIRKYITMRKWSPRTGLVDEQQRSFGVCGHIGLC